MKIYTAHAVVLRVIDGDTFESELSVGWGLRIRPHRENGAGTVRLLLDGGLRYDAPETRSARGLAATDALRALLPVGLEVGLVSYGLDAFGRSLASVALPDGRDVGTLMVAGGHVK